MARVFFPIGKGPIQCPNCGKYLTPLKLIILEQNQQKRRIQCAYCGHEWEITRDKPEFYTFI